MTNRRQFLQIGITATAWPLASTAAHAAAAAGFSGDEPLSIYKLIHDTRFAASRNFATRAGALGFDVHGIEGDMTRFWYDELYHEWRRGPVAIAGLTAHGALFCFEQLARDQGLRVVFKAEHSQLAADTVGHVLEGPVTMLAEHDRLVGAASGWSRCMADIVALCPRGRSEIVQRAATTTLPAAGVVWDAGQDPLYTWVIAPARRA